MASPVAVITNVESQPWAFGVATCNTLDILQEHCYPRTEDALERYAGRHFGAVLAEKQKEKLIKETAQTDLSAPSKTSVW